MNPQPAAPPVASYTRRVYRNELRFARDYPDLSAAARKRICETRPDAAEFHFAGPAIFYATGERFCYLTYVIEREFASKFKATHNPGVQYVSTAVLNTFGPLGTSCFARSREDKGPKALRVCAARPSAALMPGQAE
jgi:hypothetical protein